MKDNKVENDLLTNAINKEKKLYLSCAKVFEIAEKFNVSPQEIGKKCNELKIKITNCQLGCFCN